ncbi:amino acid ABC transporter permease [Nocardioides koreensis]|uniref:Amino acid ABC transporter permease n=1 Tax=Nocardioides koreensis TaxID=433651 RepID=A0ABP5LG95_9ACTN
MSGNVLFDAPGPRTIARHRVYTGITLLAILGLVLLIVGKLNETGQLEYAKWEPFVTPDYVRVLLVDGLLKTLEMAFFAIIFAVVVGLALGVGKLSEHRWIRLPSFLVVEFFRAIPVLLLMIFIFYMLSVGDGPLSSFWCVVLALTLYNGSVLAEVFRAGVNAVPHGQVEAAYALGLRKTQVMTIIQLPQAVKIMLPAVVSQCVVALKDTTLGVYILAPGLTFISKQIYLQFFNQVPTAIVVAALFIACNLILTWIAHMLQRRLTGEKSAPAVPTGDGAGAGTF